MGPTRAVMPPCGSPVNDCCPSGAETARACRHCHPVTADGPAAAAAAAGCPRLCWLARSPEAMPPALHRQHSRAGGVWVLRVLT